MLCMNEDFRQRLAVFQAGCIPDCTAQRYNLQHLIHVGLQLRILEFLVRCRITEDARFPARKNQCCKPDCGKSPHS